MAQLPGHDRTATRVTVFIRVRAGRISSKTNLVATGVAGIVVVKATNNGPPVHGFTAAGQQIGEDDARDFRGFDAEFTTILGGSIGFGIPHVDMARAATHPKNNDGLVVWR